MSYDRYSMFKQNGKIGIVPFGKISERNTDFFETYIKVKQDLIFCLMNIIKIVDMLG